MKKKVLQRCLIGAPIGLAISTIITIFISFAMGDGKYYAVVPELASDFGSEVNAVLIQAICSFIYGAAFAGASVIWDTDWSLTKMTVVHFAICSVAAFPIAYLMRWMDHSMGGVMKYFGLFIAIYVVIWISQYSGMKRKLAAINQKVKEGV